MILQKPYAFLIKNFRLIHLILTIMMGYLIHRTSLLLTFLNEYITRGFFRHDGSLANDYLGWVIFLLIILILGITITVYILMRIKDKPRFYYLFTIGFYIALFIMFLVAAADLMVMEYEIIDPRKIRLTRDFILILSFVQYVVIANALFTVTGFNIKKFDFQKDLAELDIEEKDYEEFEFVLGVDPNAIKTRLRRRWRYIKYAVLENLIVIITVTSFIIIVSVGYYILNITVWNPLHDEKEAFRLPSYKMAITDSYITNKNYKGVGIGQLASFVIVQFDIENITNDVKTLDLDNIRLVVNDYKYLPVTHEYDSFFDMGTGYNDHYLDPNQRKSFILVYDIDERYKNKDMYIEILAGVYGNDIRHEKIKLTPTDISEVNLADTKKKEEEMWFGVSALEKTKLSITDYEIKDEFLVEYSICILDECYDMAQYVRDNNMSKYDKTILRLETDFELDKDINLKEIEDFHDMVEKFGVLRYEKEGKLITHKVGLNDRTPKYYDGNNIYLSVLKEVGDAKKIELEFIIRNKKYVYKIK